MGSGSGWHGSLPDGIGGHVMLWVGQVESLGVVGAGRVQQARGRGGCSRRFRGGRGWVTLALDVLIGGVAWQLQWW